MLLIIILGLLLAPFRNQGESNGNILKKPQIINVSPEPLKELSETKKRIIKLEMEVKEMRFPESTLNIPVIESDIKI
jgi:hypothetical protein